MSTTDRNAMTVDIGLGNWLYRRALRTPHRKALTFECTTWTYGELQDRIDHLASALRAHGVCRGDRVGFLGFNQPPFLETLFAAARLGAIFVPTSRPRDGRTSPDCSRRMTRSGQGSESPRTRSRSSSALFGRSRQPPRSPEAY